MNPAMEMMGLSNRQAKELVRRERALRKSGNWGEWHVIPTPDGISSRISWLGEIREARKNKVFTVLVRSVPGATHYAIASLSQDRPTFHEMQRLKNELAGDAAMAVEIYPPASELVDDADMYHLWVLDNRLPAWLPR